MPFIKICVSGIIWALGFSATIGVVHAASGGLFGDILAKMLGITPAEVMTYNGDGTVANSARLGGRSASEFQRVIPGQSCGAWQCIYGFDTSGNVQCR